MWNVNTIIKAAEILLPELVSKLAPGKNIYATDKEKAFIEENFPACPNVSIDFGINGKSGQCICIFRQILAGLTWAHGDHSTTYQKETGKAM